MVRESEALSSSRDGEAVSNDFAPRSSRSGVPVSASERPGAVPPAVPDSRGVVPGWVVRSVPLLPVRHSGTTAVARFLSSFERAKLSRGDETASPFRTTFEQRRTPGERRTTSFDRRGSTAMPYSGSESDGGRRIPSLLAPSALAAEGGLAPCTAQANSEEVLELAYEAKDVLGGYSREFTFPQKTTVGWTECECESNQTMPGLVLDPFAGSGKRLK